MYQFTFKPGFGFEQKFWQIDRFGKKRHGTPIHPPSGEDQLFEYDDDFNNDSAGFVVEEIMVPLVICRVRNLVSS